MNVHNIWFQNVSSSLTRSISDSSSSVSNYTNYQITKYLKRERLSPWFVQEHKNIGHDLICRTYTHIRGVCITALLVYLMSTWPLVVVMSYVTMTLSSRPPASRMFWDRQWKLWVIMRNCCNRFLDVNFFTDYDSEKIVMSSADGSLFDNSMLSPFCLDCNRSLPK